MLSVNDWQHRLVAVGVRLRLHVPADVDRPVVVDRHVVAHVPAERERDPRKPVVGVVRAGDGAPGATPARCWRSGGCSGQVDVGVLTEPGGDDVVEDLEGLGPVVLAALAGVDVVLGDVVDAVDEVGAAGLREGLARRPDRRPCPRARRGRRARPRCRRGRRLERSWSSSTSSWASCSVAAISAFSYWRTRVIPASSSAWSNGWTGSLPFSRSSSALSGTSTGVCSSSVVPRARVC